MASERQNMSDQDISIKAREHELYVKEQTESRRVKPFPEYLRETPAEPLSRATKAILWVVGVVVALLFLAALWRVSHKHLGTIPPARPRRKQCDHARSTRLWQRPPAARSSGVRSWGRESPGRYRAGRLGDSRCARLPVSYGTHGCDSIINYSRFSRP